METVEKKYTRKIPDALIYDLIDGKPYYRKGYKSVLNKTQTIESIMGRSGLQTALVEYLMEMFFSFSNRKNYHFFTNEVGLHLGVGNNVAGDICLFERSQVPASRLTTKYLDIVPLVQIEIDVSIDLNDTEEITYINKKTSKLLAFGVGKVIWVFTASESILVATPQGAWQWMNWSTDVELLPNLLVNIGRFMASINEEQK